MSGQSPAEDSCNPSAAAAIPQNSDLRDKQGAQSCMETTAFDIERS